MSELVKLGSKWKTRGHIPCDVVIIEIVSRQTAKVKDEKTGAEWLEPIQRIELEWSRRVSMPGMH